VSNRRLDSSLDLIELVDEPGSLQVGNVAVGLTVGEEIPGLVEAVTALLVTTNIAALGVVVVPAAHREVSGSTRATNPCRVKQVKIVQTHPSPSTHKQ
jgi:hypothetical protein